jgi:hypothetical protein
MLKATSSGAIVGAAGATALNAATYTDMAWRGRPSSNAPQRMVETIADRTGNPVAGSGERRNNRLTGLGVLSGITTGVGIGAVAGMLRASGPGRSGWPMRCPIRSTAW